MNQNVALALFELVVLVLSISLHDCAQAWFANRMGDPTARMLGRISLNPVKHADILGTLIWPVLFIFQSPLVLGWGKPVPITSRNFRRPGRDEMLVYLAGILTHLAAAIVFLVLLVVLKHAVPFVRPSLQTAEALALRQPVPTEGLPSLFPVVLLLYFGILVNLLLFAFNLIPLPALDGGKVLRHFLPYNAQRTFDSISLYLMIGFFFVGFRIVLAIFLPLLVTFDGLLNGL
jgi:Zn-dependent protease